MNSLNRAGIQTDELYQCTDLPEEFLRDPSYWLDAKQMEKFLEKAEHLVQQSDQFPDLNTTSFAEYLGHESKDLQSWGVLDSVLRMITGVEDIFSQPGRFISYFISPAPPIGSLIKSDKTISFDIPVSNEEYPLATTYVKAAVEAVPSYIGAPLAGVKWKHNNVQISWAEAEQANMFDLENDPGRVIKPELAQDIVVSLEKSQKELEKRNQELLLKNQELEEAKISLEQQIEMQNEKASATGHNGTSLTGLSRIADSVAKEVELPLSYIQEQLMRLSDYMGRSQQLITLLVGQGRKDKQVSEAMRRMDWAHIQSEYPNLIQNATDGLYRLKTIMSDLSLLLEPTQMSDKDKAKVDMNGMIEKCLQIVSVPALVNVNFNLMLDRSLNVHALRLEQAILNLTNYCLKCLGAEGDLRIRSMRMDSTAVIEIFCSSTKYNEEDILKQFAPFSKNNENSCLSLPIAKSIIERHDGELAVLTNDSGMKFIIQLPV